MMTSLAASELATIHGGFGDGSDGWTDAMSNGCGTDRLSVPNGTWRQACVDHDHRYFLGGTPAQRRAADQQLRTDMVAQGAPRWLANAYYAGVRVGGASHFGTGAPQQPGGH